MFTLGMHPTIRYMALVLRTHEEKNHTNALSKCRQSEVSVYVCLNYEFVHSRTHTHTSMYEGKKRIAHIEGEPISTSHQQDRQ